MLRIRIRSDLRGLSASLQSETDERLKAASKRMLHDLAAATPVDTGLARDSWRLTRVSIGKYRISNLVPYIGILNRGSSEQAPAHFIENTALRYGKPQGVIAREIDVL